MEMENARIVKGGYILEGDMHCVCGHQISVEDGILMTGNRYTKIGIIRITDMEELSKM